MYNVIFENIFIILKPKRKWSNHSLAYDMIAAVKCSAGSRADDTNTACVLCPIGEYQPQTNMKECVTCPENFTTRSAGSVSFLECLREYVFYTMTDYMID